MAEHRIKYYPVDNGDTSLISLSDGTKILIDIDITDDSVDNSNKNKYNVLNDLLNIELNKVGKIPYVDAFILTHPDEDHCRGFKDYFYLGNPSKYDKDDERDQLILIYELWYTPCIFEMQTNELNDNAKAFKKEALRRMALYLTDTKEANKDGNRIRIIGYTDAKELTGLESRITVPGNLVTEINGKSKDNFALFIHAPFKDQIEGDDPNETSIVFQAKFATKTTRDAGLAIWGGDAGWRVWQKILKTSKDNNLQWDLFLAPHHCSWSFFNDHTDEGKKSAQQSSLDILDKKIGSAPKVIASCKEIKKNDDNPPCFEAKSEYVKKVEEKNFLVTSTHNNTMPPKPIEFEITDNGFQKRSSAIDNSFKSTLISNAVSQPKTYGK